ncbi:MAG: hypothetical protein ABSE89_10845 [Sedimentisphaerales bacterium]
MKRIIFSAIILTVSFSVIVLAEEGKKPAAFGQPQSNAKAPAQPQLPPEANTLKFPYVGEITGSEINIRSGPGLNYYGCGKISAPARVVVVDQKYSWSKILPPPGSFSWIFKQYVQADVNNLNIGILTADNVRVYAGSDEVEPMRSDSVQLSLSTGQKVRILGQPVGDYYKIAPPEGACLWTTSQYVKFIRTADGIDIKIPQTKTDVNSVEKPQLITGQVENTSRQLEQYYTLEKQFEDEKKKPLEAQDYSKIKAEINALINDPNSGKAGEYSKYLIKSVERCELAKESKTIIESQNTELQNQLAEIDTNSQEKKKNLTDTSKYAIQGIFKPSVVYQDQPSEKRYLVIDDNNKPICYAEPVGSAADANLTDYYEQKVGLIGQVSADSQSHLALIKFEKIEKIETAAAAQADSNTPAAQVDSNTPAAEPVDSNAPAAEKK